MPAAKQEKTQQLPTATAGLLGSPGEQQGPEEPGGARRSHACSTGDML